MSFIIIDNTKDLANAEMTPLLINYFNRNNYKVSVISKRDELITDNITNVIGIILSGGPILLSEKTELFRYSKNFTALIEYPNIPILGICFGFQVMGVAYGGLVDGLFDKRRDRIIESINVLNKSDSILFKNTNDIINVYQCHNDYLKKCPANFIITSKSTDNIIESIESKDKLRFGVQFHPENSKDGEIILANFINYCFNLASKNRLMSFLN